MSSTAPIGKRGEPEYIEKPQASKRGRRGGESPETRNREAKTDAAFKIQKQLKEEERAPRPDHSILRKRVLAEREAPEAGKMRKGKKGEPVQAKALTSQQGNTSFKAIPRGVVQQILGHVDAKKDLQSTRQVEKFMNQEVVSHVKGFDIPQIRMLTEFLTDRHPKLSKSLQVPQELKDSLSSSNLDEYSEALYSVRSRLIDVLAQLEPEKIDQLELAFKAKDMKLPTKFENFFQIVKIHKNEDSSQILDDLQALHETHEYYRVITKLAPDEMPRMLESAWRQLKAPEEEAEEDSEDEEESLPLITDSATFALMEQVFSDSKSSEHKEVLFYAHLCQGWTRIANGLFDKGIESIDKAEGCITGREIEELYIAIRGAVTTSEIDPKGAEKLFTILEQSWKKELGKDEQYKLAEIYSERIITYAQRGFAELQTAMNKTIGFLGSIKGVESKSWAIEVLENLRDLDEVPKAEKETVKTRIFNALQAAKDSPAKTELLTVIASKPPQQY